MGIAFWERAKPRQSYGKRYRKAPGENVCGTSGVKEDLFKCEEELVTVLKWLKNY